MKTFVKDLWTSIFTPGPTPTLLFATNVSFAALQFVLFALLLATYSIHFIILSFLCGALWLSINWFAQEIRELQAAEAGKETPGEKQHAGGTTRLAGTTRPPGAVDTTESETETETLTRSRASMPGRLPGSTARSTAASASLQEDVRRRPNSSMAGDSSGYGSTDSEWEKVDDNKGA